MEIKPISNNSQGTSFFNPMAIAFINICLFILFSDIFFGRAIGKSDIITIVISFATGFSLLLIAVPLFMDVNHHYNRKDIGYLLWGIPMVIVTYIVENYYLIEFNSSYSINGVGLRIYTWNFMFIVSLIEETMKVLFVILLVLYRGGKVKENLMTIAIGFIIFENIIYMRLTPYDRLLSVFWKRFTTGSIILHFTTMLIFFIIYDVYNSSFKYRKLMTLILSPGLLLLNIYIHLIYNYNTIIIAFGSQWMSPKNPITIAWYFFIITCVIVNLSRIISIRKHIDEK